MRTALAVLLLATSLAPLAARAESSECRHLNTQISFFEGRMARADELDNGVWQDRFDEPLDELVDRRKQRCPGYSDSEIAAQQMQQLLKLAARGAVTFFTMGMY
jgi:hypothetical protein